MNVCRVCTARSDAFKQAAQIASGSDDGTGKDYGGFVPSPNSRYLAEIYEHKSAMHAAAAASHQDDFHSRIDSAVKT
jgi:hypothetical protein